MTRSRLRPALCRALGALFAVALLTGTSAPADAKTFGLWVGIRGDYFSGTGDVFQEFDSPVGAALDAGLILFGIGLGGTIALMGSDQFLFQFPIGVDFAFGPGADDEETPDAEGPDDSTGGARYGFGLYTAPMLFFFPEQEPDTTDLSDLSAEQQQDLLDATGFDNLDEVEDQFTQFNEQERELGRVAFGWNLIKLRLFADFALGGPLYAGASGEVGYHMIISGDDVAAGAKNRAIDDFAAEHDLPDELVDEIRDIANAEPVNTDDLDGVNWDLGLYIRLEFGI